MTLSHEPPCGGWSSNQNHRSLIRHQAQKSEARLRNWALRRARLGAARGHGGKRIVGPGMARVTATAASLAGRARSRRLRVRRARSCRRAPAGSSVPIDYEAQEGPKLAMG